MFLKKLSVVVLGVFCALSIFSQDEEKLPPLPKENGSVEIPAQESPYYGKRKIKVYVYYPRRTIEKVNDSTGLFLTLHNWGGQFTSGTTHPYSLVDRYNVIAIAVDYLQTGIGSPPKDGHPYDFGYLQALDALRGLYYVWSSLDKEGIKFDKSRIYCTGGSGGGNITLMANKLAPRTFAAIAEFSGMPGLTDDMAYGLPGGSRLNAGYSKDPNSPNYLTKDAQQIRNPGNPEHLKKMKELGNESLVFVCHGLDDTACLAEPKKEIVKNMKNVGIEVDAHFIGKEDVDGEIIRDTKHSIGPRGKLLHKFADKYFLPESKEIKKRKGKADFELKDSKVEYKTENGSYVISYENGYPVGTFKKAK